ncbi:condensation domain-containing protein [Streptomycetaceae bacterium NBC_01309]
MPTWPASVFQETAMTLDSLNPGSTTGPGFTLCSVVRVTGPLDTAVLDAAFDDVVARNDILRSTVEPDGETWVQRVHPHTGARLEQVDAAGRGPGELAAAWAQEPVPVDQPPLARAFVAELGPDDHLLGLAFHHVHMDPRSTGLAVRELARAYEARLAGGRVPPLPVQYGHYTAARARAAAQRPAAERKAWVDSLAGARPMGFDCDRDRTGIDRPAPVTLHRHVLDAASAGLLERWALRRRTTLLGALLTGFTLALAERVANRDLLVMSVFEQRDLPETRTMLGPFLYPALIRTEVPPGSTWQTLGPAVRDAVVAAYNSTNVPSSEVLAAHPDLLPAIYTQPGALCAFQYLPAYGRTLPIAFGAATGVVVEHDRIPGPSAEIGMMFRLRRRDDGDLVARIAYDARDHSEASMLALFDDFAARLSEPLAGV